MSRHAATELEFDKILQLVAAHAQTRVGRRRLAASCRHPEPDDALRSWQLSREIAQLLTKEGRISLAGLDDAEPLLGQAAQAPQEPEELLLLLALARRVSSARRRLASAPAELSLVTELAAALPDLEPLVSWAAPRLGRDGRITDDASPELARLRRASTRHRQQLLDELDTIRRSHPDVVTDAPPTLRRDRYCLPVRSSSRSRLQGLLLDSSGSGATAFVEPYAVVELNNQLADTVAREAEEVRRILAEIGAAFAAVFDELRDAATVLAEVDATQAKLALGERVEGRLLPVDREAELRLRGARHPLLDERLHGLRVEVFGEAERRDPSRQVVPLDLRLPPGVRTLVVSGPNAGGKTVVLKTVGLMVLMASHGIPVPVDEGSSIPWYGHLWCHIGDEQDVAADLSTFSAAMTATAQLLRLAGEDSLVLFDELGSGTDPLEGAALGCALLEELARRGCVTIATTHLAAIALAAGEADRMDNAAMEFDEERHRPTYGLRIGRPGRSRGLEIAASTGVPEPILEHARRLLGGQHLELDHWLERLEQLEGELLDQRSQLARTQRRAEEEQRRVEALRDRLQEERDQLPQQLTEERDRLRRLAKQRLDEVLEKLDRAAAERREVGRRQREKLRQQALDLPLERPRRPADEEPEPGSAVRVGGLGAAGVLEEIRGSRALVTSGGKRLWVPAADLQRTAEPPDAGGRSRSRVRVEVEDDALDSELKLLGMDRLAAREELERFLDQALARGRSRLRVVHGHGSGALRQMVQEVCREHPAVRAFRHPPQGRGGTGATEIELESG